jgi:hypothetical protein
MIFGRGDLQFNVDSVPQWGHGILHFSNTLSLAVGRLVCKHTDLTGDETKNPLNESSVLPKITRPPLYWSICRQDIKFLHYIIYLNKSILIAACLFLQEYHKEERKKSYASILLLAGRDKVARPKLKPSNTIYYFVCLSSSTVPWHTFRTNNATVIVSLTISILAWNTSLIQELDGDLISVCGEECGSVYRLFCSCYYCRRCFAEKVLRIYFIIKSIVPILV